MQVRNCSIDERFHLFLTPLEEARGNGSGHFVFTLVGFDEFHQIRDGIMNVLDQNVLGVSADFATLRSVDALRQ